MYLKRLEIQGFKSLADKIDLHFNPGVSAIVGPNGSGKSNIADAVRWVLGEQSVKSLRGARMEDVIFSGSDRRKAVGMAEVSITLDNSSAVFNLDFSEITVTRRVYRSGESEYFINKTPCRLRDIHELFMDTGIGREGYSIIGQGKIEEILNARSEDRRLIIEEAAGIVRYKARKLQAVKKLNDTRQDMLRINDIIGELETQVGPLAEQAAKARDYLAYRDELVELEINLLVNQIEEQKNKLAVLGREEGDLNKRLVETETLYRNVESAIEHEKLAAGKLEESIAAVQAEVYHTGSTIEKSEAEIMVARERSRGLAEQKAHLQREIEEFRDRMADEKARFSGDEESLAALRERIRQEEEELAALEEQLAGIEDGLTGEQQAMEEKKAEIIDLLNEMAGVRNAVNSGGVEILNLQRRQNQLQEQASSLADQFKAVLDREAQLQNRLADIETEISGLAAREKSLAADCHALRDELARLEAQESGARSDLQEQASRLKALTDLQNDYEGYFKGVREVLLEAKRGSSTGICGVVAEIIRVPRKYETAIEVALGSALQFIVTETDDDARRAIEYLKKKRAGRATFLPLNVLKPAREYPQPVRSQGVVGMAGQLVECDARYTGVVEYLLGGVVVAETVKDAVEIAGNARHGMKIVTLDGDIVNVGGSMSGGYYQKGRAGLLGRVREIEEARTATERLARTVKELENSKTGVQKRLAAKTAEVQDVHEKMQALRLDRTSCEKDIEAVLAEKKRLAELRGLVREEEHSIVREISEIQTLVTGREEKLRELAQQDEALRLEIEARRQSLAEWEERRNGLTGLITARKVSLAGLRQEEKNYAQIMTRVMEAMTEAEAQIGRKENQVREIAAQLRQLDSDMERHRRAIMDLIRQKGAREDELNNLKNEKQALAGKIQAGEMRSRELAREIARIREQVHAIEVKKARLELEVQNSLNRVSEEFGISFAEALLKKTEIRNRREVGARISELKEAIRQLGHVNTGAIEEFARVSERYDFLRRQYADLEQARESLFRVIAEMDEIMTRKFREAFADINANFGEVFARFFGGGRAELVLTDNGNLLESGIEIVAQPPGKKPQHLSLLSGGEKALTAISLLFAILKTKPSPFCILDEIEASLDEANVDRFAAYIKEYADNTQFIIITHRKRTMEAADILYGVTMDDASVTKLVSVRLSDRKDLVDKVS